MVLFQNVQYDFQFLWLASTFGKSHCRYRHRIIQAQLLAKQNEPDF